MSLSLPCADGSSLSNGVEFVLTMLTVIVQLYICNCNIRSPPRTRQMFIAPGLAAHLLLHEGSLGFILPDIRRIGIASHCIASTCGILLELPGFDASVAHCIWSLYCAELYFPVTLFAVASRLKGLMIRFFMNPDFLLRQTGLPIRPRITSCLSEHLPTVRML